MKKHKHLSLILISLFTTLLFIMTGCQLAVDNMDTRQNEDRLIGLFITTEYLDLFDMDAYANDHAGNLTDGDHQIIDGMDGRYQGRVYADLISKTLTSEETGDTIKTSEYVFSQLEGLPYFAPAIQDDEDEHSYVATMTHPVISDSHVHIHSSDTEEKTTLSGTLYISSSQADKVLYTNPVYQSTDGSVFVVSGQGFAQAGSTEEGDLMSQTINETVTIVENGEERTYSFEISLQVSVMHKPEQLVVLTMDDNHTLISRSTYRPETLPQLVKPDDNAAYLIIETHKANHLGEQQITRQIIDRGTDMMETFFCQDDGFCIKQQTSLVW